MQTILKTSLASALLMFALVAGLSAKVVGSGNVVSETRSVSGFHGVELSSSGEVIVTQGDTEGVVIEAEDNLLPIIETKVTEGGVLHLGFKPNQEVHYTKRLVFKVAVKTLDSLVLAGSGKIESKALTTDHFTIDLVGSGDLTVGQLETDALKVNLAGTGDVKLSGKATHQSVNLAGSGGYLAADLKTGAATVSLAGAGDCELAASETLDVDISGSGDVSYRGKPTVKKRISGSGSVQSLDGGK